MENKIQRVYSYLQVQCGSCQSVITCGSIPKQCPNCNNNLSDLTIPPKVQLPLEEIIKEEQELEWWDTEIKA